MASILVIGCPRAGFFVTGLPGAGCPGVGFLEGGFKVNGTEN